MVWSSLALVALTVAGSIPGGYCQDRQMMQQYPVTSYDNLAVCNDNSTYNYYHRPGVGSGSNQWVIYFDGGHWCTDLNSCNTRYSSSPGLMSSNFQPSTLYHGSGITSPNQNTNPYWFGANHVFMNYCTSDVYRGDVATPRWQFRGKRCVAATIKSLLATKNLKAATDILLVGSSAGGPGVTSNAGDIYSLITAAGGAPKHFKLYSDGGWFIDLPEFNGGNGATYQSDAKALQSYNGVTFDSQCTSNYPGATWKCMLPMYNWAFLPAPLINHEYLYDTGNLAEDNAQPSNYESFRTLMTASFNLGGPGVGVQSLTSNSAALGVINGRPTAVAPGKPTPYNSTTLPGGGGPVGYKPTIANQQASTLNIYAEACFLHTTVDTAQFTESQVNGVNFNQALWQWFMDDNTLVQEVDTVAGQRTSDDCSSTFTGMLVLAGR